MARSTVRIEEPAMFQRMLVKAAWLYWKANRPFVAAFAETVFGYGDGDLRVDGRRIVSRIDGFLRELSPTVFLQFVATVALLPLYTAPAMPKSHLGRALTKFSFGARSFFAHATFLMSTRRRRTEWVETMFRRLIEEAPAQEDDKVKTIVTLTLFKSALGMAYLDDERIWKAQEARFECGRGSPRGVCASSRDRLHTHHDESSDARLGHLPR
jgi:hypothetical protein